MQDDKAVLIAGIGNMDRGDDGAGLVTARYLRNKLSPRIQVVEMSGDGTELLDLWQITNASTVYVIDAMSSGLPSGTIRHFEAHTTPLPAQFASDYSTHSFGLAAAIELARALACLPDQLFVYGIEGRCFEAGAALSIEVKIASQQVAEQIVTLCMKCPHLETHPVQSREI